MEAEDSYIARLTEAVERRNKHIEQVLLPKLKEQFRVFHGSCQSLVTVLQRKGLIQEDPYKSDQKKSDIVLGEDTDFSESERALMVGVRLSELDNALEYTDNYVEFTVAALSFAEIRKLADLVRYVSWDDLKVNCPRPTTRGIATLVTRLKSGTDKLAAGILSSSLGQLRDGGQSILESLNTLRAFQRERYKLDLRVMVFPMIPADSDLTPGDPDSLKTVRTAFARSGMKGPFVPELASEVISEERSPDAAQLREETLAKLATKAESQKARKRAAVPLRQTLLDAIRSLAVSSRALDGVMERLRDNAAIIQSRRRSLGERLAEWLKAVFGQDGATSTYDLEFMDETTGTRHREAIDLNDFLETLHKKAMIYGGILAKGGSLWAKIEGATEDQLYQYINKELGDVHLIHRRANAFHNYFKAQTDRDEKRKLRGVKIELTSIRNAIAKASQLKHEYMSRKEEQDQLRKLGIEPR